MIEKEMHEQNEQQAKKFRDIKVRTEQIRKDYEKRQSRVGAFVPQTYGQALGHRLNWKRVAVISIVICACL
ncbi:unnamed protein product [Gongylonema pulchrum]|uniref:Uncharacterized protein n=1 Tax=Gongylonema pulchrum TaxID=637853 RepID=A0A3P7P143_9BILA|nr:unnamed protein product [Gongylonema pulchrum]